MGTGLFFMSSLLSLIANYDADMQERIYQLEQEVATLKQEKGALQIQAAEYAETVDRMKLELIAAGRLT